MPVSFSFTIDIAMPDVTSITLNGLRDAVSVTLAPVNANTLVGHIGVQTYSGNPYTVPLVLSGDDAGKFALSHGGLLPCDLMVGPASIGRGTYAISLTAP